MSTMISSTKYKQRVAATKEIMELPCHKNGDVDWNTLGNVLVAHTLGEVVCASYVDRLFGRESPGFEADTDWRFSYKEKDVVILKKQLPDSPVHCYMGRTVVDLPPRQIHDFLAIHESVVHFDKYVVECREIKSLREGPDKKDCICYMLSEAKQCLVKAKRDFTFYARWEAMDDGNCVISSLSLDYPDCPLVPGVTRAQIRPGTGWVLQPYQGDPSRTLISHLVHVDLVNLPSLINNRVVRRQPLSVHYLKQHLLQHHHPTPRPLLLPTQLSTHTDRHSGEVPTTPQIPTPTTANEEVYSNLSSLPMESNPLYQSTAFPSLGSSKVRSQFQESWRCRGVKNERLLEGGALVQRQVSTVQEEDQQDVPVTNCNSSQMLIKVDAELDTSQGFPIPFELTSSSKEGKASLKKQYSQDQWLVVQDPLSSPYSGRHSPSPIRRIGSERKIDETPDVTPGNSHQGTPPPDQCSSPSDTVEGEGRTKYLQALESKLNRLQAGDKRKLKSKDILDALTEARDDHFSNTAVDHQPATINVTQTDTNATNDPWSDSDGYITNLSSTGHIHETEGNDVDNDRVLTLEMEEFDGEQEARTGCLSCCSRRNRHKYERGRVRVTSSSLTPEEESAFLLHCDHLSKT